ncbi:type VII secretion integral membrane protein EccD [Millisia brevis]|uniref:type VII secretion integral membrane protein EccD n=1 Tax=Millisia brevis TaxID=264148 RepID=UPI00082BAD63|nr:type VII secretion integral membrane protein EccD [Millisia brevis]
MTTTQASGPIPTDTDEGLLVPEMCRVTIAARSVEIDIALPAAVPIGRLIPGIVTLVTDRTGDDGVTTAGRTRSWSLTPVGAAALPPGRSLGDSGIRDGDLLLLTDSDSPHPPPLFDDIANAYAEVVGPRRWEATDARRLGYLLTPIASVALGAAILTAPTSTMVAAIVGLVLAAMLLGGGIAIDRLLGDPRTGAVVAACALAPAFVGAARILPPNDPAAAGLAGCAAVCAVAAIGRRALSVGYATATAIILFSGLMTLWLAVVTADITTARISAAIVVAVGLILLILGPRLSIFAAGLAVPVIPRTAPADATEPVDDEPIDEDVDAVLARANRADEYLSGHVAGSAAAVAVAVLGTIVALPFATPTSEVAAGAVGDGPIAAGLVERLGQPHLPGLLLAAVVALMLMLRARSYVGSRQVTAMIVAGAAIPVAAVLGVAIGRPGLWWVALLIALAGIAICLVLGTIAAVRTFPPTARRAVEYLELAATAAVVPLLFWVAGLFALVRNL